MDIVANLTPGGQNASSDAEIRSILLAHVRQYEDIILAGNMDEATLIRFWSHDSRVVDLYVPEFQREGLPGILRSNMHITILSMKPHQVLETTDLHCNPYFDYIPVPDDVKSCGPFLVRCFETSDEWDPERLVLALFRRGHGGTVLTAPRLEPKDFNLPETIQDVDEIRQEVDNSGLVSAERNGGILSWPPGQVNLSIGQSPSYTYQRIGQSPMSNLSSPASFMTASSPASFISARSAFNSPAYVYISGQSPAMRIETIREDEPPDSSMPRPLQQIRIDYYETLHQQNIIQPFHEEMNWSGKGQHVTFMPHDPLPLTVLSHLGSSMTASVDSVLCLRIALARKKMRCSRRWTVADALREVYHLQNLRHFHIIQLVGSYLQGRDFSILMYPVDCHLGTFLEDTSDLKDSIIDSRQYQGRLTFLASTLKCLTSAVAFIHERTTKHMDIKPQNILVRRLPAEDTVQGPYVWRIYLADFGLSRLFASQGHSQTDGPTSHTPRYCAPEVHRYEHRGRSADIFSLGCVFLEILTVYIGYHLQDFADERRGDGDDESFHANLKEVSTWIQKTMRAKGRDKALCSGKTKFQNLMMSVEQMLHQQPDRRPSALELLSFFSCLDRYDFFAPKSCCTLPPEPYEPYQVRVARNNTLPLVPLTSSANFSENPAQNGSELHEDFKLFDPMT